jgi:ABC-type sulfate transport system permease subunit
VETQDALTSALDRQPLDCVIADYVMPQFNGLAALTVVKAKGLDLPFIIVSGHITGQTETMPLRVSKLYDEYNAQAAFAVASLLALLALFTLGIKTFLEWKQQRNFERAQRAVMH